MAQALERASTEHVVRFVLGAYLQTLDHDQEAGAALGEPITRLPIRGRMDVARRLSLLYRVVRHNGAARPALRPVAQEAIDVFTAALRRLHDLAECEHRPATALDAGAAAPDTARQEISSWT
jgi:hypothetical protein